MGPKVKMLAKLGFLTLSLYAFWIGGGFNLTPQELWADKGAPIVWLIVGWAILWIFVLVQLLTKIPKRRA